MTIYKHFPLNDEATLNNYKRHLELKHSLKSYPLSKYLTKTHLVALFGPSYIPKIKHPFIFGFILEDTDEIYIHPETPIKMYKEEMKRYIKFAKKKHSLPK